MTATTYILEKSKLQRQLKKKQQLPGVNQGENREQVEKGRLGREKKIFSAVKLFFQILKR